MLKSTTILALAAALVALAAAQPAAAKSPATFNATFTATYKTTWNMPSFVSYEDCFRRNIHYGFGEESWTVSTKKAGRISARKVGSGRTADIVFEGSIPARGNHTRSGGTHIRWEPGKCGGDAGVQPDDDDCGTRLPEYDIELNSLRGWLRPNLRTASHMKREKLWFDDCEIRHPEDLGEDQWPDVEVKAPATLFGSQRTIVLRGKKKWHEVTNPGRNAETTSDSSMNWKLTLTRTR